MKAMIGLSMLTVAMASTASTTDFEAYGYLNSPRDYFGLIDGYAYSPGATILDVSPGSSLYGWLAPAHSGRYVVADLRRSLVVSCGTQQSESAIVVEPCGHVGRLHLSLSTCP